MAVSVQDRCTKPNLGDHEVRREISNANVTIESTRGRHSCAASRCRVCRRRMCSLERRSRRGCCQRGGRSGGGRSSGGKSACFEGFSDFWDLAYVGAQRGQSRYPREDRSRPDALLRKAAFEEPRCLMQFVPPVGCLRRRCRAHFSRSSRPAWRPELPDGLQRRSSCRAVLGLSIA